MNHDLESNHYTEINHNTEGLVLIPVEIPVEKQDKGKQDMKKTQDMKAHNKEYQHHTQYIVKPSVLKNKYIVNNINYTPM